MPKFDVDFTEVCHYSFTIDAPTKEAAEKWCEKYGGDVVSDNLTMGTVSDRSFDITKGDKKNEVDFEIDMDGDVFESWRKGGRRLVDTFVITVKIPHERIKPNIGREALLEIIDQRRQKNGYLTEMLIELCHQFDSPGFVDVQSDPEKIVFVAKEIASEDKEEFFEAVNTLMKAKNAAFTFHEEAGERKPKSRRKRP